MKELECKNNEPYEAPYADVLTLYRGLQLLSTLSISGSFEDWELGEEEIDLEDGY